MSDEDIAQRPETPLSAQSITQKLLEDRETKQQQKEQVIENIEEWQKAANRLFTSDDGKLFAKYLIRFCQVFEVDNSANPAKLLEDNGKKKVYLNLIRPYLTIETLTYIEHQK